MINKIHHIGYLTKDIIKSINAFKALGYKQCGECIYDPIQDAFIAFMEMVDMRVELISPAEKSYIYPMTKKYRDVPYHICYEVSNLEYSIDMLKKEGFFLFREPTLAIAISDNARVAFLMKAHMGMIELLQLQ